MGESDDARKERDALQDKLDESPTKDDLRKNLKESEITITDLTKELEGRPTPKALEDRDATITDLKKELEEQNNQITDLKGRPSKNQLDRLKEELEGENTRLRDELEAQKKLLQIEKNQNKDKPEASSLTALQKELENLGKLRREADRALREKD